MSAGAVFKLIANDGKADRMIMATALLNQRIKDVMCARSSAGKEDPTPTLVDLEKTHILYVNAHFKPFAAIGFEYNKVRPASGQPTLGSTVQFSIPQFGDFFYDMVIRTRLSQVQGNYTPYTIAIPGATTNFLFDAFGRTLGSVAVGAAATTVNVQNLVRYCEFPGNRLITGVKFDVNGNPLDQYSSNVTIMLEKFTVPVGKRVGYNRLTGQQIPKDCYGAPIAFSVVDANMPAAAAGANGVPNTPGGITSNVSTQSNLTANVYLASGTGTNYAVGQGRANGGYNATLNTFQSTSTLNANLALTNAATPVQYSSTQRLTQIVDGPQTPKTVQPALELWHKLKFWFCDDVRLAIPSVSIPFGQRFITVSLAAQSALVFEFPNMYLANAATAAAALVDTTLTTQISQYAGTTPMSVETIELYINNIFVNPEIHDIYIKRIGFSLIRVYREQLSTENQSTAGNQLLSQLKWPIEYMFVGLQPTWNTLALPVNGTLAQPSWQNPGTASIGNLNSWRDWHRMTRQVDAFNTGFIGGLSGSTTNAQEGLTTDQYWIPVSTVDSLQLQAHGITIYDSFQDLFYNSYLPYNYGGAALNTPEDQGAFFVNFALFPRSYQPSGHLNISRARETYLYWTTSYVSANTAVNLIVVAVAINFLLISDGSAVLRYST